MNYLIVIRTPVGRKERAEEYPKNFALLKMAEKFKKKAEEKKEEMAPVVQADKPSVGRFG